MLSFEGKRIDVGANKPKLRRFEIWAFCDKMRSFCTISASTFWKIQPDIYYIILCYIILYYIILYYIILYYIILYYIILYYIILYYIILYYIILYYFFFFFIRPTDPTFRGGGRWETKHFIGMALVKCALKVHTGSFDEVRKTRRLRGVQGQFPRKKFGIGVPRNAFSRISWLALPKLRKKTFSAATQCSPFN